MLYVYMYLGIEAHAHWYKQDSATLSEAEAASSRVYYAYIANLVFRGMWCWPAQSPVSPDWF